MSEYTIRPVEGEADYAFGVRLFDAWFSESFGIKHDIEQMRNQWKQRDNPLRRMYLAEIGEIPVASLGYGEIPSDDGERRFFLNLLIMPEHHSPALLSDLFTHLYKMVAEHNPNEIKMGLDDFLTDHIALVEARDFERVQRDQFSMLNLNDINFRAFDDTMTRVKESGIRLITLPEYEQENPQYKTAILELTNMIYKDVPGFGTIVMTLEQLEEDVFNDTSILTEAWILALDGDQLAGMTYITRFGNNETCFTELTGVIRSHRRRGITTAMKVAAFKIVQDMGFKRILTNNEENNPMYQINLRFGFEPGPAMFHYAKQVTAK